MAPSTRRDPTVDLLRGLTIVAVVAYHLHADVRGPSFLESPARAFAAAIAAADLRGSIGVLVNSLVAAPTYRLDLFLFVTGVVLVRSPPRRPLDFLRRRARAVLPNYWLGSLLVTAALVGLAAVRAGLTDTSFSEELILGTRLAHAPYRFEALDVLRSLSILGRFESVRTFQVVAPSMWYVALLLQTYLLFPALRRLFDRLGAVLFLPAVLVFTWMARAWVFRVDPLPSFGPNPTVLYWIPFRLAPVALGMVASASLPRLRLPRGAPAAVAIVTFGAAWVVVTFWLGVRANLPGTLAGVIGPVAPLAVGLPALWCIADALRHVPIIGPVTRWAGRHSLSILVVQDVLRLGIGTWETLVSDLTRWFWPLLLPYCVAAVVLASLWDPLVFRIRERLWPSAPDRLSAVP